ncbi:DUF6491 family protein [Marinicella sediminis]|uniref:DUF6491 family protein n=1 Tax=Marinicella sediminis TaxID=1792834 RepID=A0ABV7J8Z0_9GAMM|nr:DUF6491 family protein [Marinicella sediminis]
MMKTLMTMVMVLLLAACQGNTSKRPDFQAYIADQGLLAKKRVQQFRFQGWQPLDDRHLILRSSQQRSYLIRLMSVCTELPFAQNILLKQDFSTVLNAKFDSIQVPGQFSQECTIDSIYELDKAQKKALLDFADRKESNRPTE